MKIAFIGTHGTGKTTLAHDLVSALKKKGIDADFLGEIARMCPFPINENTTKKSEIWIILMQIIKEMEYEEKCDVLVCDRSVIDGYVYYVKKFGRAPFLETLILKHLKTYDYIIKIPIREGMLKKDKIRSVNIQFQKEIEKEFEKVIKMFRIKHLKIEKPLKEDNKIIEEVLKKII
jgi:nicotinamide riboside kinase